MSATRFIIPWSGIPKPRPRVTENGTYMPKRYTDWKENVAEWAALAKIPKHDGPLAVNLRFNKGEVVVEIEYMPDDEVRNGVQGDIDNLAGGTYDALQDAGIIENDKQIIWAFTEIEMRQASASEQCKSRMGNV